MKLHIDWIETKGQDWKVASLTDENKQTNKEVHINRKDKNGLEFPNFDTLQAGQDIEGQPWTNTSGKTYLFPPKQPNEKLTFKGASNIAKNMERKEQGIANAQDHKDKAVMMSSTIRMSVDIALAECAGMPFDAGVFKANVKKWRNWLIAEWSEIDTAPPFN